MEEIVLSIILGFEWDNGNSTKSWIKHKVSIEEQEQAFLAEERIIAEDKKHSQLEKRFLLYGKTDKGRRLIIAFTIRNGKIRCVLARNMNRKEAKLYEKVLKVA